MVLRYANELWGSHGKRLVNQNWPCALGDTDFVNFDAVLRKIRK
jgi:hypothetical protein